MRISATEKVNDGRRPVILWTRKTAVMVNLINVRLVSNIRQGVVNNVHKEVGECVRLVFFNPKFNFGQTIDENDVGRRGDTFGGNVDLNVISITVEMEVVETDDITKGRR